MSSTTLERLKKEGAWVLRSTAAKYLARSESMIRYYVTRGALREFKGSQIWVARDDLEYILRQRYDKREVLPLGVRFNIKEILEPVHMDGRDIYYWAMEEESLVLALDPPEAVPTVAPVAFTDRERDLEQRIDVLEGMVHELYASNVKVRIIPRMEDDSIVRLLGHVQEALAARHLMQDDVENWITFLENFDDGHIDSVVRWAKSHPSQAQEICGAGITVLAPFVKLAACLRKYAEALDDATFEATERRVRAQKAQEVLESRCRTKILLERVLMAEGSRWLAVGMCPLDRQMIRSIWTRSTSRSSFETPRRAK